MTLTWTKAGDLLTAQDGHLVIFDGSNLLVFGGLGTLKTEKILISNGQVTCSEQDPSLQNYEYYPELFLVSLDYCKNQSLLE